MIIKFQQELNKLKISHRKITSLTILPPFDWYYTGFVHSDGAFYFTIEKNKGYLGFRVSPVFAIQLTILSKDFIYDLAKYLNCGRINT